MFSCTQPMDEAGSVEACLTLLIECYESHDAFETIAYAVPDVLKTLTRIPDVPRVIDVLVRHFCRLLFTNARGILSTLEALEALGFTEWESRVPVRTRLEYVCMWMCRGENANARILEILNRTCPELVTRVMEREDTRDRIKEERKAEFGDLPPADAGAILSAYFEMLSNDYPE